MTEHAEPRHKMTVKIMGELRTIQGYTHEEYAYARAELIDDLQNDVELVVLAHAAANAAPLTGAAAATSRPPVTAAPPPVAAAPPSPAFTQATHPSCKHGPRKARVDNYKSGPRAGQPYRAWFCPSPKDTPDQCKPIFLESGTPEWEAFPAA